MKTTANADVRSQERDSLIDRLLKKQRRKLVDAFHAFSQTRESGDSVLDLRLPPHYLPEQRRPSICLEGEHRQVWVHEISLPGVRKGRHGQLLATAGAERQTHCAFHLPYRDGQFEWVFCSEVIEHVGHFEKQYALVKEVTRVARKGAFITASNRNHPLQFHTGLPLLHWLPDKVWRRVLKWLGREAWASESVLSLLDANALYRLARLLPGRPKHDVGHKRILGIKAHFFLMIEKFPPCPTVPVVSNIPKA